MTESEYLMDLIYAGFTDKAKIMIEALYVRIETLETEIVNLKETIYNDYSPD